MKSRARPIFNMFTFLTLLVSLLGSPLTVTHVRAGTLQTDISGPSGSGQFGTSVTTLPNGNFVVTDPFYDAPGPIADVGAVYLYKGATHALISALKGSSAGDAVGSGGIIVLTNSSNFVIKSPNWDGAAVDVGAVTFVNGTSGVAGTVSSSNSLVGSTAFDAVGNSGVIVLTNGNYVVASSNWDGAAVDVGAVTWGSGVSGVSGLVSPTNSLVGSSLDDNVGLDNVAALSNGNYVVGSSAWDGAVSNAGAATWGNGTGGTVGTITSANSLIGSTLSDQIGYTVTALTNGNYVVGNPSWTGATLNCGAATWGNGAGGTVGVVSTANSLVGSAANDQVGIRVTALSNGNYVVRSYNWDGAAVDVGAASWGNGAGGTIGTVSAANSLVGSSASDKVSSGSVASLTNGNYVVVTPTWDGAAVDVGAATWGSGTGGLVGSVSAANSLVGSTADDQVGFNGVTTLTNGHYVVASSIWGATDAGAATWGSGAGGLIGPVSAANSLIGSAANDNVSNGGVTALSNGNYVVASSNWDGAAANTGAATWGSGTGGLVGAVSAANSLVGSVAESNVGSAVTALSNGNYVVGSPFWEAAVVDAGAATWGNGTSGLVGVVSASNSLVGSSADDKVSSGSVVALANGNYVVKSEYWDNGAIGDAGAITLVKSGAPIVGSITAANSVRGATVAGGVGLNFKYDDVNLQLVVGRPFDNIVTLVGDDGVVAPIVLSSMRSNPSPTAAASLDFTVTFSKPVTGVTINDFILTASGVSGATVSGVGGAGSIYTVSINTGSGNGTLRLDVVDDDTIVDSALNPLGGVGTGNGNFNTGEIYTIIKTATFNDVPLAYWAMGYIERLYKAGITSGCSAVPLNYCPDATVTRAQMAIFILRGVHGSTYIPPKATGTVFSDVSSTSFAADWIERLAAEGITTGCGSGKYCPDASVTRAQMAIFLLRGEHGSTFAPPAATGRVFSDVPIGTFADAWIEQLFIEGITSGCGGDKYCPNNSVTRAEMAVFLVRTFKLP